MVAAARLLHRESHRPLLHSLPAHPLPASRLVAVDAVVVPASRPACSLTVAADLAARLDCVFVALCSRNANPEDFAVLAVEWPSLQWAAASVPADYQHPLLQFATSNIEDVRVDRLGDLSLKRNLALLIARIAGWRSMLLLDDDICAIDEKDVRRGTAALDRLDMVGLAVQEYPDNSVVCHANRMAGRPQEVFVGGSALLVNCERRSSFFPEVYNEDWFFLYDSVVRGAVGSSGTARQLSYDPFADPARAVAEEFGDLLAEGLYSLLHEGCPQELNADIGFWRYFLDRRREFIEYAVRGVHVAAHIDSRPQVLRALREAECRRAAITPESCAAYLKTWRRDQSAWEARLEGLDRPGSMVAAVERLGLHELFLHSNILSTATTIFRKGLKVSDFAAGAKSCADLVVNSVIIDPEARVADTSQIGAPYRRLQEGEWERRDRPTRIAAHCDIGHFCVIGEEVVIGERSILDSYTLIEGGATLGQDVMVTQRASIGARAEIADGCVIAGLIGERSKVGRHCRVFGELVHRQLDPTRPWDASESMESSPILEEQSFVGRGAIIIGGVTVGRGAYVCAGAKVTRDVPEGVIVTGINQFCRPEQWKGALGKSEFFHGSHGPAAAEPAAAALAAGPG